MLSHHRLVTLSLVLISCFPIAPMVATATLCDDYQFSQSTGNTFTTVVGASGTTKIIAANQDDVASSIQNIGFSFTYDGTSYTQFSVSDNGLVGLGSMAVTTTKVNGFTRNDGQRSFPSIAPFWGDLKTGGGTGGVYMQVSGAFPSRCLTIEFLTLRRPGSGSTTEFTYQVKLFESTNCIEFRYGAMSGANTTNTTIGFATSATRFLTLVLTNDGSSTTASTNCVTSNDNVDVKTGSTPISPGTIYAFCPAGDETLPVELTSFTLASRDRRVELNWQTASEVHNAGFEVYRADVDTAFRLVASYQTSSGLNGLGTSSRGKVYRYVDGTNGDLQPGQTYTYRLVDVSTEGVRRYHTPRRIRLENLQLSSVVPLRLGQPVPNPATGSMTVAFDLVEPAPVSLAIYSTDGRRIALPISASFFAAGHHVATLDVSGLAPGTYHVRVSALAHTRIQTLVIAQ